MIFQCHHQILGLANHPKDGGFVKEREILVTLSLPPPAPRKRNPHQSG